MPATQSTRLGRRWLVKMSIFFLVFFGMALYGLYDATLGYPARGAAAASRAKFVYLDLLTRQGKEYARSEFEPKAEFERLRDLAPQYMTEVERARLQWLEQLKIIGKLDAENTAVPDTIAEYNALAPRWQSSSGGVKNVTALSWYDIPVQWLIFVACAAVSLWILSLFIAAGRLKYGWDPAEERLYLPGGATLTPADIAEFDKRRWDKFLIFLKIRAEHPTLGGKELKLDLYRYEPLEDWVLAMERTAFPQNQAPPPPAA